MGHISGRDIESEIVGGHATNDPMKSFLQGSIPWSSVIGIQLGQLDRVRSSNCMVLDLNDSYHIERPIKFHSIERINV